MEEVLVEIVEFPETRVAAVEFQGPPDDQYIYLQRLISWRMENGFLPSPQHRTYGLHYNDIRVVPADQYRVDFCVSVEQPVAANAYGVVNKILPASRCAKARHIGSREDVAVANYLYDDWLPSSGETFSGDPIIFHYVNVGPQVLEQDMITDVYLPLK